MALTNCGEVPARLRIAPIFSLQRVRVGTGAKSGDFRQFVDSRADAALALRVVVNRRMQCRFASNQGASTLQIFAFDAIVFKLAMYFSLRSSR